MNWNLDVSIILEILSAALLVGMGWQKLNVLERDVERLEVEIVNFRELKADIKVIETKLSNIDSKLGDLVKNRDVA